MKKERPPIDEKPVTKRQLELLLAVHYGEVYEYTTPWQQRYGRGHAVSYYENTRTGRDVNVTSTMKTLRNNGLVRRVWLDKSCADDAHPSYVKLTPRGITVMEDRCTDLV